MTLVRIHATLALCSLILVAGCGVAPKKGERTSAVTTVPSGTEVRLALLTTITSGGSRVGERVPLAVLKDVKDSHGRTVIPAGSIAWARVTRSRGATTFTALANQPARLEIQLETTTAIDGTEVPLCTNAQDLDQSLSLTRSDSSRESAESGLRDLLADQKVEQALIEFAEMLESGERPRLLDDSIRSALEQAANGAQVPDEQSVERLSELLKQVRSGSVSNLAPSEVLLAIATAQQVIRLVEHAGDRVAGMLKGANIKIWAGTPLTAYVAKETPVTIQLATDPSTR